MKTFARWLLVLAMAFFATVSLRAPGFAGWFSDDEEENEAAEREAERKEREAERAQEEIELYDEGTEALDESEYEEAAALFDRVVRMNGRKVDGALYWKAYALGRQGRRQEALAVIEQLKKGHAGSRWLDDAKALEVELRQTSSKPVRPESEDNEELKLIALNGLMQMDEEQAVPMLERFLSGNGSRKLKEQALFVLVQTGSPRAREILYKTARGQVYPALQRKAVELIGIFGESKDRQVLKEIYTSTQDDQVKRQILQAYMVSGDEDSLAAVAATEKNESLRREAINLLGAQGADDKLARMYETEASISLRKEILQALAVSGSDFLFELARRESNTELRAKAVQSLGIVDSHRAGPVLSEIYAKETDRQVRRSVLDALFVQGNARAIINIARREKDPELRRAAVEKLTVMGDKEAAQYLMEILEE